MGTKTTCTTPGEGWALVAHYLGNRIANIRLILEKIGRVTTSTEEKKTLEDQARGIHAELIESLEQIADCMRNNGHDNTAAQMQAIIDVAKSYDSLNPTTYISILSKHKAFTG